MDRRLAVITGSLVVLLLVKFLYPLFAYGVPLGFDPGIYRFLLLEYAESFKSFSMPDLLPWANEYPPGLFVLLSPLVMVGVPVDALIGWVWNLVPVFVLLVLAWVTAKRTNTETGVAVLLIGLLSQAYFDGFYAMYYKAFVSLFFVVLTYHLAEKMSPWLLLTSLAAVMIHQQTGLVLALSLAVWWAEQFRSQWKTNYHYRLITFFLFVVGALCLLWYLPQWERAIWSPLKSIFLLRGEDAPGGAFPETVFYIRTMTVVLILGLVGFLRSFRTERGSLWQLSVIVCIIFIVFKLVFYRRFYLQFDFFLMPFAASALLWLWQNFRQSSLKYLLGLIILAQVGIALQAMHMRTPRFSKQEIDSIRNIQGFIPSDAAIIALENASGTWMKGWLPHHRVGAPGLFDFPGWSMQDWRLFIDGEPENRKELLSELEGPVYFLVSSRFMDFYKDRTEGVLNDPCLVSVDQAPLLQSTCSK